MIFSPTFSRFNQEYKYNCIFLKDQEKRKKPHRPAPKLFDVDAIRAIGGEVTTDGDFLIFENNRYNRQGFLFKSFVMSAIVSYILDNLKF